MISFSTPPPYDSMCRARVCVYALAGGACVTGPITRSPIYISIHSSMHPFTNPFVLERSINHGQFNNSPLLPFPSDLRGLMRESSAIDRLTNWLTQQVTRRTPAATHCGCDRCQYHQ
eukprot:GHVU01144004.1.p1 GENE.GHVU01144004.1~~GHVU01144004.1.p1  ORF type:complete len:117 (-),score=2.87 GHVU01144004.1:816-1166(-)